MGRVTARVRTQGVDAAGSVIRGERVLPVEEPLEIRLNGRVFATVPRTPGDDVELAIGLLIARGIVTAGDQVFSGEFCPGRNARGRNTYNVLAVTLAPGIPPRPADHLDRQAAAEPDGVGADSRIEATLDARAHPTDAQTRMTAELAAALVRDLGALGGFAGLADATTGHFALVKSDVHLHRAVDKVIGAAAASGRLPLAGTALVVAGSPDLAVVTSACLAGAPIVVAGSVPTASAERLAARAAIAVIAVIPGGDVLAFGDHRRLAADPA